MPEDPSAWFTAVLITLMAAPWLMTFIPRCSHAECREAHKDAEAKERKATQIDQVARLHAYHDRFRPQPLCALCQADKRDQEP